MTIRTAWRVVPLTAWALAMVLTGAHAQSDWRTSAVPFYTVEQYAQASARDSLIRAEHWQSAAEQLQTALQQWCAGGARNAQRATTLQADWRASTVAWDGLDSIALGPLVERRSARSVDFMPTRPAMLERALKNPPKDAAAMERIGAPAKGFEALEWLLWPQVPDSGTPRCDYAVAVAAHQLRESRALVAAFGALAQSEPDPEHAKAAFSQAVNQWVGGVEQLRWAFMRKPLDVAATRGQPAVFPRARSHQTADSWAARWNTLRAYAVLGEHATPQRLGGGQLIAFETWLRSRGANGLADKLVQATTDATQAIASARTDEPGSVQAASNALGQLTWLMQSELAPKMDVQMGFSDADGD